MLKLIAKFQSKIQGEEGATAVEYGLMVALIAAAIIVAVGTGCGSTRFTNIFQTSSPLSEDAFATSAGGLPFAAAAPGTAGTAGRSHERSERRMRMHARHDSGATAVEYALMARLIAAVIAVAVAASVRPCSTCSRPITSCSEDLCT